jgi:NAD(P)-dependent dehydrogenase (short-subunit alcohol dehydrogenase family)
MAVTFIGPASPSAGALARALGAATSYRCPAPPEDNGWGWVWDDVLDDWRRAIEETVPADALVVCAWPSVTAAAALTELEPAAWRDQVEWPTALWFTTLVAAAGRCADRGSLVVVVERPVTIDAPGHAALVAVSDGLINLVRSLAAIEGARGVRVNAVATEVHTASEVRPGAPPALDRFPGSIEDDVAGAVRLLLSPDASGVTGAVLPANCGR